MKFGFKLLVVLFVCWLCCLNSGVCCITVQRSCHSSGGYYPVCQRGDQVTISDQSCVEFLMKTVAPQLQNDLVRLLQLSPVSIIPPVP
jgi:hypothetical protein